jgi:glycosyltransferase involved in cell wall biosynthesis
MVVDPSLRSPARFFKAIGKISQAIKQVRPDVIHIQQAGTLALAAMIANRKARIPVIITVMGSDVLVVPKQGWLQDKMVRVILRKADFVTCDAEISAQACLSLTDRLNGVSVVNFGVDDLYDERVEKERLVYSNRLHESIYRIEWAMELFSGFAVSHPEWRMVIAGQGSLTLDLKRKAASRSTGKYEFTGWLAPEDNISYYRRSAIYLSLPESDATSVSLLEAMSAGCIPVVSDLPANREWVQDGVNGIIDDGGGENPLKRAICLNPLVVARYNRQMLAERASRSRAKQSFIDIYEKIFG